jgi:peptidoglycan/LPS O-acetylase OafA/YrhL
VNWWSTPYSFAWWSLTVEVSFYILFPILVPIFRAIRAPTILFATFSGALLLSAVAYNKIEIPVIRDLVNYAICFVGGLVLASCQVTLKSAYAAMLSGLCMTIASTMLPSVNPHIGWGLFYVGVVAAASDSCSLLSKPLSSNSLVWLGERSYSLFLTHHTVIVLTWWAVSLLTDTKGAVYYVTTRCGAVVIAMLVAMTLFNFVERRFATGLITANSFWPPFIKAPWLERKQASDFGSSADHRVR